MNETKKAAERPWERGCQKTLEPVSLTCYCRNVSLMQSNARRSFAAPIHGT